MSETIKDGTGGGHVAKVDDNNRLLTNAVATPRQTTEAANGNSYFMPINDAPLASGVLTPVIYLKNTDPELYLYINILAIGWNGGNTNHNRAMTFYSIANTGVPTSGTETLPPFNFLIGSGKRANATFMRWDKTTPGGMVLPNPGLAAVALICAQGMTYHPLGGTLVFMPGQERTFALKAEEDGVGSLMAHVYFATAV